MLGRRGPQHLAGDDMLLNGCGVLSCRDEDPDPVGSVDFWAAGFGSEENISDPHPWFYEKVLNLIRVQYHIFNHYH